MILAKLKKKIRDRIYCYLPLPDYYGRDFKRIYSFLQQSCHWSREQIQAYKLEKIRALLLHAQANVPYYRDLFKSIGLDMRDIKSLEDFSQIPILSKETLQNNIEQLQASNFKSYKPLRTQTSGTTSQMTVLYRSRYQETFRKAVVWRFHSQHGHNFRDRWVVIACRNFDPKSPVCEYNHLENCLLINTYHIIRGCRDEILDAIRDFQPTMIWTHPSPLAILAEYALSKGIQPIRVPVVATFAEKIYPHVRKVLQEVFPGKYVDYFANRENSFASWGNSDDRFYEISEYCHMEVARRWPDGVTGDLITTSLHNYAVPLIRYDPGDIVKWCGYQNSNTPYPMIELLGGRGKDVLVTHDGLTVPYFLAYIDAKNFNKLRKYQIEQVALDEVILRVVPKDNYIRQQDEPLLLEYASESLGNKFRIRLEYVDDIPLTDGGKYRPVVSKLAVEYFDRKHN
ncbi:MAG: phenylacetate--CoA ligase family protein [Candidatus Zixiibacteriota bacterium]|nr:MAG: phenylacetate--CoA ligase family protein [candidate division Zixibacteria bacterium]